MFYEAFLFLKRVLGGKCFFTCQCAAFKGPIFNY